MCKVKIRGISLEQIRQLVEMTRFFYDEEDDTHIFEDPDIPSNIVISSGKGDNYNTVGWFQVCFDLILPKVLETSWKGSTVEGAMSFMENVANLKALSQKHHPVNMLYSPFLAIKSEKENDKIQS